MAKELLIRFLSEEDWQRLLAPIKGESPCGKYLLYESIYGDIRDARREDDPTLSQEHWQTELKRADWKLIQKTCQQALSEQSKDLQLAVWLMEAWVYLHGMEGFYAGTELLLSYCERYWEDIFPPLEGDDFEMRLSPFVWMNAKFYMPLGSILISDPDSVDAKPYTFLDRENAPATDSSSKEDRETQEGSPPTRSMIKTSITLTPHKFYEELSDYLQGALENINTISESLNTLYGDQSPSFGKLSAQLDIFLKIAQQALKSKYSDVSKELNIMQAEETSVFVPSADATSSHTAQKISITSRKDAYLLLSYAAEYLLRTEPHSPTPYLVKRAISWGDLSLSELLLELVNNNNDLLAIYQLLGMKPPDKHG